MTTIIFAALASTTLSSVPPRQSDSWHRLLEEKARATLAPHSADYPKGYGHITCSPAEDIKSDGNFREAVVECALATSCGPSGTIFLYRTGGLCKGKENKTTLQFSEPTSGYMGGYYELADLSGDGVPEVITVSGTDGVAPSHLIIRQRAGDKWITIPTEDCGPFCSAHDYIFVRDADAPGKTLISVRGCELERGNEKPCTSAVAKLSLKNGALQVTPLVPGPDESFHTFLDGAVAAVQAADRKEPERNEVTLRILGEIYDQAGLRRPPPIEKQSDETE